MAVVYEGENIRLMKLSCSKINVNYRGREGPVSEGDCLMRSSVAAASCEIGGFSRKRGTTKPGSTVLINAGRPMEN